jgi:hypothetical protein
MIDVAGAGDVPIVLGGAPVLDPTDVAGAGNVLITLSGAPVLDPTDEGELEIEPFGDYASSLLYCNKYYPFHLVLPESNESSTSTKI